MSLPSDRPAPHQDPARWGELVDSIDAATVFVVLADWLGPIGRREASVEDIWQETLWLAWRDRQQHQWEDLTRYRSWLLGIARNRIHDLVRAAGRQKRGGPRRTARFSDLGGPDTVGVLLPVRSTTPSYVASHMERARVFERALTSLPTELREVVRLRLFEELSMQATASLLEVPLSTAKHRFVRGLQAYRAELTQQMGEASQAPPATP